MLGCFRRTSVILMVGCFGAGAILPAASQVQEAARPDTAKAKKATLPLEPGRTISLETDEGSWISLDVSPDGGTIVFDLLGDLYTVPREGGGATRITQGMAYDAQPRFSPDGEKILFVSDRSGGDNLWTLELATGDTAQITQGNGGRWVSPDWTPDGEYVVASKGATRLGVVRLWMGHVDGGSGADIHKEPANLETVGGAVSPDGRYIWYARRTGSWEYNATFPQYQLGYYDRETGRDYARSYRYGSAFRPTLSPDGRWLVFGTRHEDQTGLRIRELETGEERWLAYPVQHDDQESIADQDVLPGMSFTPDSRELVASYGGKIWRIPVDGSDPIAVPFQVNVELEIGPELAFDYPISDSTEFNVRQIRGAVPSPDGERLAFIALDRLYVMEYPAGTPRRLTESTYVEAHPTWSPDGEWIAYVTWSAAGGHIWRVASDGDREPEQLTRTAGIYQNPAWAPGGDRIVAIRGPAQVYLEAMAQTAPGATTDIVWVPAGGGGLTVIAPTDGRAAPHFAGNGERIYLFHGTDGLVSIRWDGTDEKAHLKVVGNQRPGQQQPNRASSILMAPVGDQALVAMNNDVYVVTVPYVGGDTPTVSVADPDKSAFPARKLTVVGGQFPAWEANGRKVHWSIGNAHFVYDLDAAEAVEDSIRAAAREEEAAEGAEPQEADTTEAEAAEENGYKPDEERIVIRATRDIPRGTLLLRGGRIITMRGDQVLENADLLIRDNRIVALGPAGSVQVPDGAEEMDVSGKTIVPGFVDVHSHMWPPWGIHKGQVWLYLANLAYGVTTTRDPQTSTTDILSYGDLVESGEMLGPRLYSTGPGIFGDYQVDPLKDLDHVREIVRIYRDYYDTKTIKMYMSGNRQQRQWVIMAAREHELMPTTEGGLEFKYDLTMMIDGYPGQEHNLPVFPIYKDVVTLAAESKIAYTPTLIVSYGGPWGENYFYATENVHDDPKLRYFTPHSVIDQVSRRRNDGWYMYEEYAFPDVAEGVRDIVEAGGRATTGSHGQLQGLGYHWELWMVQSGGMSELDALKTATIFPAEAIGLDQDLGSIEVGKLADLVILDENPLQDIRNTNTIRQVMKNGRLYDGDTLNEVWPRQRALERSGWILPEPGEEARAGIRR